MYIINIVSFKGVNIMNPMEYFKMASQNRNKTNEELRNSFIEDTAPSSEDLLPILSPKQKKAADNQNLLIQYISKKLGINPYAVSRDKRGHAIVLELKYLDNSNYPELYCYAIGLNTETQKVTALCVGKNTFRFTRSYGYIWPSDQTPPADNLHINVLSTHPGFDGMGIGRILMQATENLAISNKLKTMSLKQEVCYVPNSQKLAQINRVAEILKDKDSYFQQLYFDKNMYFYYTNGFTLDTSKDYYIEVVTGLNPLKKDRLRKVVLDYGLAKPLVKVSKTDPMFALKNTEGTPTDTAREYCYNNRFPTFLNNIDAENFSPIVLKPNNDYTRFLYAFITTRKHKEVFTPTTAHKRNYARNLSSGNYECFSYKFNNTCSSPEFIQSTMESYEEATDTINNSAAKPFIGLNEMLCILEENSSENETYSSVDIDDELYEKQDVLTYYKTKRKQTTSSDNSEPNA